MNYTGICKNCYITDNCNNSAKNSLLTYSEFSSLLFNSYPISTLLQFFVDEQNIFLVPLREYTANLDNSNNILEWLHLRMLPKSGAKYNVNF